MSESSNFKEKQYAFAAHIRDPDHVAAPDGIEARRMAVYRKLFFNNLYSLLGKFFPVLRKIHSDARWHQFVRGFMQHHHAQTPYPKFFDPLQDLRFTCHRCAQETCFCDFF